MSAYLVGHWTALALDCAWKAAVILALACVVAFAARRSSAAVRHFIWTVAIAGCLSVPLFQMLLPEWHVAMMPQIVTVLPGGDARVAYIDRSDVPAPAAGPSRRSSRDWGTLLLYGWSAGAMFVAAWVVAGIVQLRLVAMRSRQSSSEKILTAADDVRRNFGIARRVAVLQTSRVTMPLTYGVWNPLILLPSSASTWAPARLRAVLLHEFGHVKRFDWFTQTLAQIACAVYWFNPLVWMAAVKMRREREHACDDAVLNVGVRGSEYAEHLVFIARSMAHNNGILTASAAMAQPSQLEGRVRAVLNNGVCRTSVSRKRALLTTAAVALLLVPVASVRSVAQSSSTGAISGTVSDISGRRVPNAVVLVKSLDKSNKMELTASDAAGEFEFKALPAGKYTLEVRSKGFAPYISKELVLTGGAAVRNTAVLDLGTVNETMDVIATSPMARAKDNEPKRIPVGGNVQATKLIKMVRPVYPETAKAAGIEGSVLMKAVISREGDLLSLEVVNSLVDPELAKAARDAVSQWKYAPTLLNGEPVEVITTITVNFKLSAN